jgi:hypothetical protein
MRPFSPIISIAKGLFPPILVIGEKAKRPNKGSRLKENATSF